MSTLPLRPPDPPRPAIIAAEELTPEQRARRAFEAIAGGPMTDGEWAEAEGNLGDLFEIACQWRDNSAQDYSLD